MVAGSRLSIDLRENVPPRNGWEAWAMNQFIEANLPVPRGPVCWISVMKASPWSMRVQWPALRWTMSIGEAAGLRLVPEACMGSAGFMPGISAMPGMPFIWLMSC